MTLIDSFLQIPLPTMVIFAIAAGLIATGILSFFFMKNLPAPDNQDGESGWAEVGEQENFWKKRKDDMKGWT